MAKKSVDTHERALRQRELNEHIRTIVRALMGRDGLNQHQLASRLGWPESALYQRMNPRNETPFTTVELWDLADVFGVPRSAFLDPDGLELVMRSRLSTNTTRYSDTVSADGTDDDPLTVFSRAVTALRQTLAVSRTRPSRHRAA